MKWAKILKDFKLSDFFNIILTLALVIVAILQFHLSDELGNIQKSADYEKLLNSRKELRETLRDVYGAFSYKGIKERLTYTARENIALARNLYGVLLKESANPLLVHDPESLEHWYRAISVLEFYDKVGPEDFGVLKEDGTVLPTSGAESNKIVVDSLETAWHEVKMADMRLKLSSYDFLNSLEHKKNK